MSDVQLCALRVGAESYVVDLRRVDEIIPAPVITRVPKAPSFIKGITKLRGEVLPVIDVRERLGVEPMPSKARERLLVVRIGRRRIGLLVDAVTQVLRVPVEMLKAAPMSAGAGAAPFVLGVCGEGAQLKLMLDVKALLEDGADDE